MPHTPLSPTATNLWLCCSLPWSHIVALQLRHNGCDSVSNHQPHDCLLNGSFRRRSKKTSKLRVTGLCAGKSPVAADFPAQMASDTEKGSIWWRHHSRQVCETKLDSTIHLYAQMTRRLILFTNSIAWFMKQSLILTMIIPGQINLILSCISGPLSA